MGQCLGLPAFLNSEALVFRACTLMTREYCMSVSCLEPRLDRSDGRALCLRTPVPAVERLDLRAHACGIVLSMHVCISEHGWKGTPGAISFLRWTSQILDLLTHGVEFWGKYMVCSSPPQKRSFSPVTRFCVTVTSGWLGRLSGFVAQFLLLQWLEGVFPFGLVICSCWWTLMPFGALQTVVFSYLFTLYLEVLQNVMWKRVRFN